jgi:hypothetical protein
MNVPSDSRASFEKVYFEITGGLNVLSMYTYNDELEYVETFYKLQGMKTDLKGLNYAGVVSGTLVLLKSKGWATYFKVDYLIIGEDNSAVDFESGQRALSFYVNFDSLYTAIGVRKYFKDYHDTHMIRPFVGADMGVVWPIGNFSKTQFYYIDGSEREFREGFYGGAFLGASIEVGADYWMQEGLGLIVKGGYRIASGRLRGVIKSTNPNLDGTDTDQEVEYSGI